MRLTISQLNRDAILPQGDEGTEPFTSSSYTAPAGDESFSNNFSGFDVDSSVDARAETKALMRNIINKRHSDGERKRLIAERKEIIDKKFAGAASQSEINRLEYINWTLDQIEDARHGAALDRLEMSIARYESFLEGVDRLTQEVQRASMTRRTR